MKQENMKVKPKVKALPFGRILVTADAEVTKSGLIITPDLKKESDRKKISLKDIQEVVFTGVTVKAENGTPIEVGDKVLLNTDNPKLGRLVMFDKATGEMADGTQKEEDCDLYILLEAREVLMVF